MFYFAFGADVDAEHVRGRVPGPRVVGLAALRDHRLAFPRFAPEWGGGVASIGVHHGGTVWGIVYDVPEADMATLDRIEGFRGAGDPHNVAERQVVVVDLTRPDDGSIPRRLSVSVYLPKPSNPSPPSARYRDTLVRGARSRSFPEEYVAALSALPVGGDGEA